MRIGILGTGSVGRTLAAGVQPLGNEVVIGTRDPKATLLRDGPDGFGTWAAAHPEVTVATFAEAAAGSGSGRCWVRLTSPSRSSAERRLNSTIAGQRRVSLSRQPW